ncbi:CAP domain-containing protein [Deinococcus roseus]|uniref:SCP domain-containing protein n=1 Tax=Deinococcus roseus TaxID=392414 RepID=A0ABQ2CY00_9DEIO|nr:CAP domain-containing protein [Deinococcus roseus]GGJ30590.1 hypothetical protein GCM10008938_15830 [Deinococcus roseus]
MQQRFALMAGALLLAVSCNQSRPVASEPEVTTIPAENSILPQATSTINSQILTLVNQARATARVCGTTSYKVAPALKLNTLLTNAAQLHSQDMASKNFFSHTGSNGSSPFTRITAQGYKWRTAGENIAAGYATAQTVVSGWLASPGHCANIMNPNFKDLGVGYAYSSTSTYKHYWTNTFAAPY